MSENSRFIRVNTDSYSYVDVYLMRTATSRRLNHQKSDTSTLKDTCRVMYEDVTSFQYVHLFPDMSVHVA